MRDEIGNWVFGYNKYLEKCSIVDVKFWEILKEHKLIQRDGHDEMIIQLDNLEVVKIIGKSL